MRWVEIVSESLDLKAEAEASCGVHPTPPMTPAKMRARQAKRDKAQAHVADVRAANAVRLQVAQRKAANITEDFR